MILDSRKHQAHSFLPIPYPTQGLRSIVLSLGITSLLASIATAPAQALSLTFVGEGQLSGTLTDGNSNPVGGLSGIAYTGSGTNYFVVSDSPTTPRVYTINLTIAGTTITPSLVGVNNIANLANGTSDLEGIARDTSGNIFLSSEGQYSAAFNVQGDLATATVSPFVRAFNNSFDNATATTFPLPSLFTTSTTPLTNPPDGLGPRSNLALESLTITPDGNSLFTAVEAALKQDQSFASLTGGTSGSLNRIQRFDLSSGLGSVTAQEQYLYTTDVGFGLSDLLAADNAGTFYALERAANTSGTITGIRIFETSIAGATNISGNTGLGGNITGITQATKTLLVDFQTNGLALFNYEGLAFDSTGSHLIVVSDNNFNGGTNSNFAVFATPVPFGIESGWLSTLSILGVVGGIAAKQQINKRGPDQ
ncbi:MAG: hypothetical protein RLZZ435_78 [Cyanobacteriota bacterium]